TEQLSEAENLLEGMDWIVNSNPMVLASRIALYKDLAVALRDRGSYERAAYQARKGYFLAESANSSRDSILPLQQETQREQMILAALAISSFERAGKKKEASELIHLVEAADFQRQPALKTRYEAELIIARLIGNRAPELAVSHWLESNGLKIADLNG